MSTSTTKPRTGFPKLLLLAGIGVILVLAIAIGTILFIMPQLAQPSVASPTQMRASLAAAFRSDTKQALAPNGSPAKSMWCQCVDYFIYKLNNGRRVPNGNWPTAASMASQQYWNQTAVQRTRSQTAQPGDIIIMQSNAKVYPWNNQTAWWDTYFDNNPVGDGAGHIGIVQKAEYWDKEGGWYIQMRSANWAPAWGYWEEDAGCNNVSSSYIFVPNGDPVSFWRAH